MTECENCKRLGKICLYLEGRVKLFKEQLKKLEDYVVEKEA